METVKICTKLYIHELMDFYLNDIEEFVSEKGFENDEYYFYVPDELIDAEQLVNLMEDIILDRNPVVNDSQKICDTIKQLVFSAEHEKIKEDFARYIDNERIFNLDGYIHFRLQHYPEQINSILYSIVRKNLCIEY